MIKTTRQLLTLVDDGIEKMKEHVDFKEESIWELRKMFIDAMGQEGMINILEFNFEDREDEYE